MGERGVQSSLSEVLRREIISSGLPLLTLEQKTGVQRASIRRFLAGEQSIVLDKADKLAAFLGLSLAKRKGG